MREKGTFRKLIMNSVTYSESCPLYCEQTPFRRLTPSGQMSSCDYCTQTVCKKSNNKPQADNSHYREVLNRSWQSNTLRVSLQLFPALPRVVLFTHPKLPKVLPAEHSCPANCHTPCLTTAPGLLMQQTSSLSCAIKWLWVSEEVHIHKITT